MTTPVEPGDIVSVPDPSTGGAGAPVIVSQIVNAKWRNAFELVNKAFELGDNAVGLSTPAPQMPYTVLDKSYLPPLPPTLPNIDPNEGKTIYDDSRAEIDVLIQSGYGTFLTTYFPDGPFYQKALDWLSKALDGGTGINAAVEQQLWERDKARVLGLATQSEKTTFASFANRGFPVPPGAMVGQITQIRLGALKELAGQSRDIAVKSFDAELENVRFAVSTSIDLRKSALQAAGDYIRTLILGPQTAVQLATSLAGLKTALAQALTAMYSAQVAAVEPFVRLNITDAQLHAEADQANLRSKNSTQESLTRAALANANMVGGIAASSLNGINAGASISGSDSSSV
jgi:hypothetical protein